MRAHFYSRNFFSPQRRACAFLYFIDILVQTVSSVFFEHLPLPLYRIQIRRVIAITHVANKMIRIIGAMLTLKEPYKSHDVQRYGRKMKRMDKVQRSMHDVG